MALTAEAVAAAEKKGFREEACLEDCAAGWLGRCAAMDDTNVAASAPRETALSAAAMEEEEEVEEEEEEEEEAEEEAEEARAYDSGSEARALFGLLSSELLSS